MQPACVGSPPQQKLIFVVNQWVGISGIKNPIFYRPFEYRLSCLLQLGWRYSAVRRLRQFVIVLPQPLGRQ